MSDLTKRLRLACRGGDGCNCSLHDAADRLEAQDALLREVWGALDAAAEALDWALAEISEYANIMSRDPGAVVGIAATLDENRATLAKLREHLEDKA